MRARRRQLLEDESPENFWPSFADLTSTIALILFVLVLLAYIQNLISGKNLQRSRVELDNTLQQLHRSQQDIAASQQRLAQLSQEIKLGQAALQKSRQEVEEQAAVIIQNSEELNEVRGQVAGIGMLRLTVLEKVKQSLEAQLGGGSRQPVASIADNGNIVLDESLLFPYNSSELKPEARTFLNTLARAFANVLSDPTVRENIDVILVQGHTDDRGSGEYNRDLSARRSTAVLNHMFTSNPALEQQFGRYFASSAYSKYRPVRTDTSEEAYQQNRRIEISVVLKDTGVRAVIDEYFKRTGAVPAPNAAVSPGRSPSPANPSPDNQ